MRSRQELPGAVWQPLGAPGSPWEPLGARSSQTAPGGCLAAVWQLSGSLWQPPDRQELSGGVWELR